MSELIDEPPASPTPPQTGFEIETVEELTAALASGIAPGLLRLQDLDLREFHGLDHLRNLHGLVVLGGELTPALDAHLRAHGALIFPSDPEAAPIRPYRATLYTAEELYAGLSDGYAGTIDARAYAWSGACIARPDVFAALLQAIHDDSISDALTEFIGDRAVVGVMGGHAIGRGGSDFRAAAELGFALAGRGYLVATGGGPGAMEAANLGAAAQDRATLEAALSTLAQVPTFADIGAWATLGLEVRATLERRSEPSSLGIPTWYYGHEPPNVFPDGIAKYFSNAIREDGLLARATAGVVVLPGAAGTAQEIFQAATRSYYAHTPPAPLILVGHQHWTESVPVWPALVALGRGRAMGEAIHLVDDPADALPFLLPT